MDKITDLIARFGGLTQMSRKIQVPIPTIQSWGKAKKIPAWRLDNIIRIARQLNIKIEDLCLKGLS